MKWRWMIAENMWDETMKLGQYRIYQSLDSLGEGRVKEIAYTYLTFKKKRGWNIRDQRV